MVRIACFVIKCTLHSFFIRILHHYNLCKILYRGIQGSWCPQSVLFYNLLFFVCILWAIHSIESDEPLQFVSYYRLRKKKNSFFNLKSVIIHVSYRHFL